MGNNNQFQPQQIKFSFSHPKPNKFTQRINYFSTIMTCDQFAQQLRYYQFRKKPNKNVIRIIHLTNEKVNSCSNNILVKIFTEDMTFPFASLWNIDYQMSLKMLIQILNGYQCILRQFPFMIDINDDMIFQNQKQEIKVWINSNLALNFPKHYYYLFQSPLQIQHCIIVKIIKTVARHTKQNIYPKYLIESNNFPLSFVKAKSLINEELYGSKQKIEKLRQEMFNEKFKEELVQSKIFNL